MLNAARALLAEATTYTAFTVDAVAKRADVARATVYYQFHSKTGLLEALCDDLAEAGGMGDLGHVFAEPDPQEALHGFIATFGRFWAADRLVMRRLRALAALDADVHAVVTARDEGRRQGLQILVGRLSGQAGGLSVSLDDAVRVLQALTSFETFDSLAGADGDLADAAPLINTLAAAWITGSAR